jgi:hypothetical protein
MIGSVKSIQTELDAVTCPKCDYKNAAGKIYCGKAVQN